MKLKIPPVVIMLLCGVLMYFVSVIFPMPLPTLPWLAAVFFIIGLAVIGAGVLAFRRHRTTVNPHTPDKSRLIVADGIYRFSRNPMYLGMALILAAWALWLSQAAVWLGVAVFVMLITRLQIRPEEQILSEHFGEAYRQYCRQTRRWL
ncbi:Putative protein-S-isoprenylcysteine methyltransferase [Kingella potus]|uniref:Steroid 5-alpha reductase C-terminal domain-containing protein n=1 Tax=Kingella potus TaxID=265175 RepID=A0A377R2G6_9NEIS|nr:isoprenylcysteine carboxylmethyltransferase family protein [Kingella potus]UOP00429.1 isoprenylcysteine carboxylmethyltransferase family protein [Kingella potus]STR02503.1 Putative protein-S-isoprenylcysteine methyltransferase [Kingella potus]